MKTARLTLKNYRGFSDQNPARIEIGPRLTALLGQNNAGKSSLKLFFYEMRDFFLGFLRERNTSPNLMHFMNGSSLGINYVGVSDVQEIFNNTNEEILQLSLK